MININNKFNIHSKKLSDIKKIWSRNWTITTEMVGFTFFVHQGKRFIKILVTENMIGHKFGEFAPTRKRHIYKKKRLKK